MGWSISPNNGLVSINQNGLLTYQQHTSDVTYTISYDDDEGCSATKSVIIKGCTPTCNCADLTVTGLTNISKDGGNNITIGTLSKASCMSNPTASSSESWLSNITVSGNDIKATVASNPDSDSRNGSVTVTVNKEGGGTCNKTMSIKQLASGGGGTFLMYCAIELRDGYEPEEEWWADAIAIEYLMFSLKKPGDTEYRRYKIPVNLTGYRNSYMSEPLELDEEWKGSEVAGTLSIFVEGDVPLEYGRACSLEEWLPDDTNMKLDEGQSFRAFCIRNNH